MTKISSYIAELRHDDNDHRYASTLVRRVRLTGSTTREACRKARRALVPQGRMEARDVILILADDGEHLANVRRGETLVFDEM